MIKIKAAARELDVSERFLRQLIAERKIPVYKLSPCTTRVDLNELRGYMRRLATGKLAEGFTNEGTNG